MSNADILSVGLMTFFIYKADSMPQYGTTALRLLINGNERVSWDAFVIAIL